jgi:ribosomal protein S18 acetylase RimI-like enzyme
LTKNDRQNITSNQTLIPASQYTYQELADIYNEARVDYIVPMPMNAKRMQEYVQDYDIVLDGSYVIVNANGEASGIGMLGMRDTRCWITRLGIIPYRRLKGMGQSITEQMLAYGREHGAKLAQLEVIVGNEPARSLFEKLGFRETRTLLIIRRPPSAPEPNEYYDSATVTPIEAHEVPAYLAQRAEGASWVEETQSLLNTGNLRGVAVVTPEGQKAWVIFQRSPFQLTHFVLSPNASDQAIYTALYHVHKSFPMQDTKIENVPLQAHEWDIYQNMGYLEVFQRTEMFLYF